MPTNTQLKGNNPGDPWFVIEGNPVEILDQIGDVFPDLATTDITQLPSVVAKAQAHWRAQVSAAALGGTEVAHQTAPTNHPALHQQPAQPATHGSGYQAGPTSPAPSQPATQGQGAQGRVETDRWGGAYEWDRPDAPYTPTGLRAVLKRGTSKEGKSYARWIDPRSKAIPSVYASGVRNDPPDLWPGDFAPRGI